MRGWNKKKKPKHHTGGKWKENGTYFSLVNVRKKMRYSETDENGKLKVYKWVDIIELYSRNDGDGFVLW